MATTTKKNMFNRMLDKYMGQYKPNKVEGLSMTMDGNIALAAGDGEFAAIVDDHIENYPAEAIMPDIPFYSIQRPADQIKEGDYVFLNGTAEGRKLAKVTEVHTNKVGKVTAIEVMRFNGTTEVTTVTTDKLTGITTMEVVINMFDGGFMNMGQNGNPMMLVAMASMMNDGGNGGKMDFEKMFMMSMMMGGNPFQSGGMLNMTTNPSNNPMMAMAMMSMFSGDKEMDFGKMWMMSAMMGGNNPFQGMFQQAQPTAPAQPTRKTRSDKGTTKKPRVAPDGDGQADQNPDTTAGDAE